MTARTPRLDRVDARRPDLRVEPWEDDAACRPAREWAALTLDEQRYVCSRCPVRTPCAALAKRVARSVHASTLGEGGEPWAGLTLAEHARGGRRRDRDRKD